MNKNELLLLLLFFLIQSKKITVSTPLVRFVNKSQIIRLGSADFCYKIYSKIWITH